jgi:DNA-binding transcriptional MerR regulator
MRVTDLARRADTTAETVRHYTDLGLLTPRRDPQYNGVDLSRLRFALKARSLGFTLGDVRELIEESEGGETPCPRVRSLIEARLAEVEARIRELSELSARMRAAMDDWSRAPDCHLGDGRVCGLIDSFNAESAAPR